ncbi:MAG: hypothetical protein FOGNACKC_05611 [Anaerolineae bacterium]|nr:hypothetical protein [Anaerolineae bacterium]
MVMFSYFTFYLVYPFIIKNVKEKSNKKFLKLALIALALEFFLANILYLMPSLKEDSGFTFIYITAHTINFQIFRISLLFYLIREFFDPWYETLPKN